MDIQNKTKEELIVKINELLTEKKSLRTQKEKRAAELIIANKQLLFQNEQKEKRAAELIIANNELLFQNQQKEKRAAELVVLNEKLKEAEVSLIKSNKTFLKLFDDNPCSMAIRKIKDGVIVNVNSSFLELFGFASKEEVIGKTSTELKLVLEDEKYRVESIIAQPNEVTKDFEVQLQNKNGDPLWVSTSLLKLEIDNEPCLLTVAIDITERKQSESALIKIKDEFHLLAESMPQIVWITLPDGMTIYFNQKWIDYTGLTLEESYGKNWIKPFHPDDQNRAVDSWQNAVTNNAKYSLECRLRRKDGDYFWWLVRGVPVFDKKGNIVKWFGTCTDIQDIKEKEIELVKAKEKAEESDQLKSAFLANMSHEIRTPMNGILGFADLLKQPGLTGKIQQEYIAIIEKSGTRMLNIINDIVDISKIEAGLMEMNPKKLNINKQIGFISTFFRPQVEEKGLQFLIRSSLSDKEAIIKSDGEKIYSILTNLVKNAIKFTKEGTIELGYTLKTKNQPAELEFYVKDTGIGIPKSQQAVIFERFIQADLLNKMASQGTGLGLSISKAYVEMLGGKIWVESEEGKGSTFYFTLPYQNELEGKVNSDKSSWPIKPSIALNPTVSGLKILVAEDDKISRLLLSKIVKANGKTVLEAKNGSEAVAICRSNPDIDLILMDIQMPELNGYEATRQIRQFNKDVVIIAQSAFGLSDDREKSILAGCNDYISKPINKLELLALIFKYFNN